MERQTPLWGSSLAHRSCAEWPSLPVLRQSLQRSQALMFPTQLRAWRQSVWKLDNYQPCQVKTVGRRLPHRLSPCAEQLWEQESLTSLQTFKQWCWRLLRVPWTTRKRHWSWERLSARGKRGAEDEMVRWLIDSMDMSLSKLWEIVKDWEAWRAAHHGSQRVGHNWATEQQQVNYEFEEHRDTSLTILMTPDSRIRPGVWEGRRLV